MAGTSGKGIDLYSLDSPYYYRGSPVIVSSGTLFMDRFSEEETIRLTIQNITDTGLVSCEVRITLYDGKHTPYGDDLYYRYDGLKVERGKTFGGSRRIPLPDNGVRSFDVSVTEVILGDYTHWENTEPFEPISPQETLRDAFQSEEMAKQYAVRYGNDCTYMPAGTKDLWYCACGAVNHASETRCYKCRRNRTAFAEVNEKSLKRDSEARVKSEKILEEAEQREKEKKNKTGRLILRISIIVLPVLLIAAIILSTVPPFLERRENYAAAEQLLAEGSFAEAQEAFLALGDYSDARQRAEQDVPYERAEYILNCAAAADPAALQLLGLTTNDVGDNDLSMFLYGKARDLFLNMDGYRDSQARLAEIDAAFTAYEENQRRQAYDAACALLENACYLQARNAFLTMNGYLDSGTLAEECLYRRSAALLNYCETNNVRGIRLSLSDTPDISSAISMRGSALAELGSERVAELKACLGGDAVSVFYEEEPGSTEESSGRTYLPICDAVAESFRGRNGYRDSEECAARAETAGDFTAEFYRLLRNGDLSEAAIWLNTYDDDVPERDYVSGWVQTYETWRRYWKLYGGDSTLIPITAGLTEGQTIREFSSKVRIENWKAILCLEQVDGEYVVELECDAGNTDFSKIIEGNYYYARINNANRLVYMWYIENGTMLSSCEYAG